MHAVFETAPPPLADADALAYSARQYLGALEAAGATFAAQARTAPRAWFFHGGMLPCRDSPVADERVDARVSRIVLEPQLAAAEAGLDAASLAFLQRARLVVTTCGATGQRLAAWLPPERLLHLAPFCDLARPMEARRSRAALRANLARRLGIGADAAWLVTVGGDDAASQASMRLLIRALSRLLTLDWQLLLASPVAAGGPLQAALLSLPRGRVQVMPEALRAEPDKVLALADLFVWPAVEGVGRHHLLRAHALGIAAVACDEAGVTEIVQDALTGRIAPAGNAESFANCVGFLLRHPGYRSGFGVKALETVIARHDLLIAARHLRQALADLDLA